MGVSYLLDTHVLLWLWTRPARLPEDITAALADRTNALVVSAVCALEVATKVRLGKLLGVEPFVDRCSRRVASIGAVERPVSTREGLLAGSMSRSHREPFDRLLAAQATVGGGHLGDHGRRRCAAFPGSVC